MQQSVSVKAFCLLTEIDLDFLKWADPGLFFVYFQHFQLNITILHSINVENVHLVSSAGIRTHNLLIMSLLP